MIIQISTQASQDPRTQECRPPPVNLQRALRPHSLTSNSWQPPLPHSQLAPDTLPFPSSLRSPAQLPRTPRTSRLAPRVRLDSAARRPGLLEHHTNLCPHHTTPHHHRRPQRHHVPAHELELSDGQALLCEDVAPEQPRQRCREAVSSQRCPHCTPPTWGSHERVGAKVGAEGQREDAPEQRPVRRVGRIAPHDEDAGEEHGDADVGAEDLPLVMQTWKRVGGWAR